MGQNIQDQGHPTNNVGVAITKQFTLCNTSRRHDIMGSYFVQILQKEWIVFAMQIFLERNREYAQIHPSFVKFMQLLDQMKN